MALVISGVIRIHNKNNQIYNYLVLTINFYKSKILMKLLIDRN